MVFYHRFAIMGLSSCAGRRKGREKMIKTQITAVSVYRSGCVISRETKVCLQEGFHSLKLLGPGPGTDAESLRLSVPEGVQGSHVQLAYLSEEEKAHALEELQKEIDRLARRLDGLDEQMALWRANADFSGKENISIQEMTAFLEGLPARLESLEEKREALREEKARAEKERAELGRQLELPFVSVDLIAAAAGEYPLELKYKDESAAWAPSYELHAQEEESGRLLLRLRAQIAQDTGEDWSQVKLHLFSGNPAISGTIPPLYPQTLHFFEAPRMMAKASMTGAGAMMDMAVPMMMEEAEENGMDRAAEKPRFRMSQVVADSGRTIQGDSMTEYELAGSWDIRDGQSILCDIRSDEIPCRYQVVAVPRFSEEAYLSAEVKTTDLEEMQQVEAAVYLKGNFAGRVFLQPDMTEEEYHLSLGIDETVKVKRTQKKRYTSQVLLKGQKKTEYEYEIAAASRKPRACSLLIRDQIPVTEEKTIQVEAQNLSGGELEEKTGIVKWEMPLQPGENKSLTLAYSVAWPKDKELMGV